MCSWQISVNDWMASEKAPCHDGPICLRGPSLYMLAWGVPRKYFMSSVRSEWGGKCVAKKFWLWDKKRSQVILLAACSIPTLFSSHGCKKDLFLLVFFFLSLALSSMQNTEREKGQVINLGIANHNSTGKPSYTILPQKHCASLKTWGEVSGKRITFETQQCDKLKKTTFSEKKRLLTTMVAAFMCPRMFGISRSLCTLRDDKFYATF